MIKNVDFSKRFTKEEFRCVIFVRFLQIVTKYAEYCRANGDDIDVAMMSGSITGEHLKSVLIESGVYFGQVSELLGIIAYVAFPNELKHCKLDLNPVTHVDMLNLCHNIMAILKTVVNVEDLK